MAIQPTDRRRIAGAALLVLTHGIALALMLVTEADAVSKAAFLLAWALLNGLLIALSRRPLVAALLSFELLAALVLLSRFKHDKLWMTIDFVDVLIIDQDTWSFLLAAFPTLRKWIALALAATVTLAALFWWLEPVRLRRRTGLATALVSLAALSALSLGFSTDLTEDFLSQNYVSKFARSGVEAVHERFTRGYLDYGPEPAGPLAAAVEPCPAKLPHVILLHDESSFDITAAPGIKVPAGYQDHFRSFDGRLRRLTVEGVGGPSWFAEYNVLTGLSVRSYGRFATSVTRIAAGRVERGLPRALKRCGYTSFSLYPFYGAFLGSRAFQTSVGIDHYLDMADLGTRDFEADSFYFEQAAKLIARERGKGPLFLFVYNVANHFPWDTRLRPELTPDWRDPGNDAEVDEYIRRQAMTATDYKAFLARLAHDFPGEPFLIVRYGDHQPQFGPRVLDPGATPEQLAQRARQRDPRYLTTYYAIDAVNFTPTDTTSAIDALDAAYLPLIVQEAAGIPLGPSFAEQKRILHRCEGLFYACAGGAEARRFNRLLVDAALVKGL